MQDRELVISPATSGKPSLPRPATKARAATTTLQPGVRASGGLICESDRSMSNKIIDINIPAGSRVRIGVPAERPDEAIEALIRLFDEYSNVISARLGLMEVEIAAGTSQFTYTIGIDCTRDSDSVVQRALDVLRDAPMARWPISLVPSSDRYFTSEAIVFYRKDLRNNVMPAKNGWIARLLGK